MRPRPFYPLLRRRNFQRLTPSKVFTLLKFKLFDELLRFLVSAHVPNLSPNIRIYAIANIRMLWQIEGSSLQKTFHMPDSLRQFKANIFQALAHPTRIAIVEILRDGELPAGAIIERLGLEQANASQHFSILRAKQIVNSRKEGNQVFYSVRDPLLIEVLDIMRRYFQAHVEEAVSMLQQIDLLDKEEQRNRP